MTLLLALLSSPALASVVGTPELDGAVLSRSTLLQVDILDHTTETIAWTGGNSVPCRRPDQPFALRANRTGNSREHSARPARKTNRDFSRP